MYVSPHQLVRSIHELAYVHPFHGITFVACKKAGLPIGATVQFRMDAVTKRHMDEHHRLSPESAYYYQPFNTSRNWVKHDYPSSGLQAINTQTFKEAFVHPPSIPLWAWAEGYVDELYARLSRRRKIPAIHLAIWLLRSEDVKARSDPNELLRRFFDIYKIAPDELDRLFDLTIPDDLELEYSLNPASWASLRPHLHPPPDAPPERGGTLAYLELNGTGPSPSLSMEPAEHLTLITGDNGLGKTFILECAWWALTGEWAGTPALPRPEAKKGEESIRFSIRSQTDVSESVAIRFDWESLSWPRPRRRPTLAGLIIYARVDGSFSVWDPTKALQEIYDGGTNLTFAPKDVWDGREGVIEGMVRDWGRWQRQPDSLAFQTFCDTLALLSPPDLGPLVVGDLTRIPNDPRDIPTVKHHYGDTPIVFASAGVKRILSLAYLMVWAWEEHRISSDLSKRIPETRMVVLIDEMEAHLHPRWQREVLPALASAMPKLAPELEVQLIVATHSPLILASAEPIFNSANDSLFHFDLDDDVVRLRNVPFLKRGDVSRWLTSRAFGLKHARSRQAERAIEEAKKLQSPSARFDRSAVVEVTTELKRHLAEDDVFWPRWIGFAERFDVPV
ncbi:MAG: ATP-binding protein [Gammaproteobacteria bacterium]|nr:ATP-binding protein [Gammaproteobacteria bacterium]